MKHFYLQIHLGNRFRQTHLSKTHLISQVSARDSHHVSVFWACWVWAPPSPIVVNSCLLHVYLYSQVHSYTYWQQLLGVSVNKDFDKLECYLYYHEPILCVLQLLHDCFIY